MISPEEDAQSFTLEQYLSRLTLQPILPGSCAPPMPPPNARSTMTPLTVMPGGYRRLAVIEPLTDDLAGEAAAYFSKLNPVDCENIRGLKLDLQEEIAPMGGEFNPYVVHNALNVATVLDRFLLRSTKKLLWAIDSTMHGWTFQTVHRPYKTVRESQSLDPIVLCHSNASGKRDSVKLVLLPLGPWEFTPKDFHEFAAIQRFDDTPNNPEDFWEPQEWVNADRMRAYLYDLCLDFDCPYFVVTSHIQWSFGSFSNYYTTAFITPPISYDHRPTSIVEILMYWIHVAFGKPNTISIPIVDEEENMHPDHLQTERQLHAKRFLHKGLPGLGDDVASENTVPAKRKRCDTGDDDVIPATKVAKRNIAIMVRRRNPPSIHRKLPTAADAKKREKPNAKTWWGPATESVFSVDLSVAPSSADPLPDRMIPRRKNAAIQRWRDLVAIIEEHGEVAQDPAAKKQGRWVDMLLCDPTTGELTGDFEQVEDHTCSSCGPSSASLSDCSLSEEELARWDQPTDPDPFRSLRIYQWG